MCASIGSRIKALRAKVGICQGDICCEILSQTVLSKIENDKMLPSIPQLKHIADCLGAPINYFFHEDDFEYDLRDASVENMTYLKKLYDQKKYYTILELYETGKHKGFQDIDIIYYTGMSYYNIYLYNSSLKMLRRYVTAYKKLDETQKHDYVEDYAGALNKLHCIMLKNANYDKAIKYLSQAKNELERHGMRDRRIFFVIINNIGTAYCKSYKFDEAIEILEEFFNTNMDIMFLSILPWIHVSLNTAYYNTNNFDDALKHIKQAVWLFSYSGQDSVTGECYLNYIDCLRFQLKFDETLDLISKLMDEYCDDGKLLNLYLVQKMIVLFDMERFDELFLLFKEVNIDRFRKRSKMECYFMLGHVEFVHKEYSKAYCHLKRCEKYLIQKKFYYDLRLLYEDLFCISGERKYKIKSEKYKKPDGIYNILIKASIPE